MKTQYTEYEILLPNKTLPDNYLLLARSHVETKASILLKNPLFYFGLLILVLLIPNVLAVQLF